MIVDTDDLIRELARNIKPLPTHAVELRLASGVAAGAALGLLFLLLLLGVRPDLASTLTLFPFWLKTAYAVSIATVAIIVTSHLARPESRPRPWYWLLAVPAVLLAGLAALELAASQPADRVALFFGQSADRCSLRIFAISVPVFAGLAWAFRGFAPTQLRVAGAAAGLSAGAIGATLYVLHCQEVTACFVLIWYTLGIGLPALAGALLGPSLLRW